MRRRRAGLTLLEILVASAVAGLLLTFLGTYFARQAAISTDVRDRAALHLTLRTVAEAVAQDLASAGARAVSVGGSPGTSVRSTRRAARCTSRAGGRRASRR